MSDINVPHDGQFETLWDERTSPLCECFALVKHTHLIQTEALEDTRIVHAKLG
jgi:hypothetical protein